MASWDVARLLDHVQELLGEPVGNFYNISTRLDQLNQAQRELSHETRAISGSASIAIVSGTRDYAAPADFLAFDRESPVFVDLAGNRTTIHVVDTSDLDIQHPGWQDIAGHIGTPGKMFLRNGTLTLYPTPNTAGTLTLPYLVEPTELTDMDDVPFNGLQRFNRFAPALAYKVAFVNVIARAPQHADTFSGLYEKQERLMRHFARSNSQYQPGIRPTRED